MNEKSLHNIEIIQKKVQYHPDPTLIFNHLCHKKHSTLLLETAEINKKNAIESIIIIDSAIRISAQDNIVELYAFTVNGIAVLSAIKKILPPHIKKLDQNNRLNLIFPAMESDIDEDKRLFSLSVFDTFRLMIKTFKNKDKIAKAMFFGGLFSYDLISHFESIPILERTQKCPDFCFYLAETILVLDHPQNIAKIQSSLFIDNASEKKRIQERIKNIEQELNTTFISIPTIHLSNIQLTSNINDIQYSIIIKKLQKLIHQGEIFQVVPSRKFFSSLY